MKHIRPSADWFVISWASQVQLFHPNILKHHLTVYRGPTEEVTHTLGEEDTCQRMLAKKKERTNFKECYVPLDLEENQINDQRDLSLIKTLYHEGEEHKLQKLRARCKKEKVQQ